MPKRIDPLRHWSIVIFVPIAVISGVLLLPIAARIGGWKLQNQSAIDLRDTAIALAVMVLLELILWLEFLELLQNWRIKRVRKKKNPYDQP